MIDRLELALLAVPLERPYKLAFGPVTRFDTLIVRFSGDDGACGFGEATYLTGYTEETPEGGWAQARAMAERLAGCAPSGWREAILERAEAAPFTATAFHTALEMLEADPILRPGEPLSVPILGLLNDGERGRMEEEVARLLAAGFRTLKFKVGFDPAADAAAVARAQAVVAGRALIRVDANQGYTAEQAEAFIAGTDPAGIELFEQPCAAGDWAAHERAARAAARRGLPLMLDESIYGVSDIERAAREGGTAFVKLKLMKLAGLERLERALARIRELGMTPVLGNGVACDVGCWMEACVAARAIDNAGEMNGFLKATRQLMSPRLGFSGGAIVAPAGYAPRLDEDALAACTLARAEVRIRPAAVAVAGAGALGQRSG